VSFHSSPQKTRLRLFSEPGSGKSELGYETGDLLRRQNASRDGTNRLLWESFRRSRGIGQQNDTGPDHTSRAGGNIMAPNVGLSSGKVPGEPISSTDVHVPDDSRSRSRRPKSEAKKKTSWVSRCPQSVQPATHRVQLQVGAKAVALRERRTRTSTTTTTTTSPPHQQEPGSVQLRLRSSFVPDSQPRQFISELVSRRTTVETPGSPQPLACTSEVDP
jgi:hypothetical protein